MKVQITFDLDDDALRHIAHAYGEKGKAKRGTARTWIQTVVDAELDTLASDYEQEKAED